MFEHTPPAHDWRRTEGLFNTLSTGLNPNSGGNMSSTARVESIDTGCTNRKKSMATLMDKADSAWAKSAFQCNE